MILLKLALAATTVALIATPAMAQQYPTRPINMIVGFPAGGSTDIGARVVAGIAEKMIGQPIVVVNKGGAGGQVGWTELARAKPTNRCRGGRAPEERSRECEREKNQRQTAEREQQPVSDALASHRLIRYATQKHQRREHHDVFPLLVREVHEDRHGKGNEPGEEERRQKRHQRTRDRNCRRERNSKSAKSSGVDVSNIL